MRDLWVIEARNEEGRLDFYVQQPERVFGIPAITGITTDEMAKTIYRIVGDTELTLDGRWIELWPMFLNLSWRARRKTW